MYLLSSIYFLKRANRDDLSSLLYRPKQLGYGTDWWPPDIFFSSLCRN